MPSARDLNRPNRASENPFDEPPPTFISAYTAQENAALQARLDKQLGPEYVSTRQGPGGGRIHYLAAEKAINLANEVFGFNGWSSQIQQIQVDFVDESQGQRISIGLSVIVRVTLKDGTFHEDIGYGHIENCKGKAAAFEKAKKEGATDALKRALRNFGNVLGNCLYDKDYLQKISKIKPEPSKWTPDQLHRHPDYVTKQEPVERTVCNTSSVVNGNGNKSARVRSHASGISLHTAESGEDEFGDKMFDDNDFTHPDEVRLDKSMLEDDSMMTDISNMETPRRPLDRGQSAPNLQQAQRMLPPQIEGRPSTDQAAARPNGPQSGPAQARPQTRSAQQNATAGPAARPDTPQAVQAAVPPSDAPLPGFVTGRSAESGSAAQPFNPHAESPSIRRTAGLHSGKSEPILRSAITGKTTPAPATGIESLKSGPPAARTDFVNPQLDANRRVGMPMVPQISGAGRGTLYKPPSIKRPAPQDSPAPRPPLADTTNVLPVENGNDAKRPKIDATSAVQTENVAKT